MINPPGSNPKGPSQKFPYSSQPITNDPKGVDQGHSNSDVNSSKYAQHHTLGAGPNHASPGNHIHDGALSKLIPLSSLTGILYNTELISFTGATSFTAIINFSTPFAAPPVMIAGINTGSGVAAYWSARATGITTTGFNLFLFPPSGGAAQTWVNIPVSWVALGTF